MAHQKVDTRESNKMSSYFLVVVLTLLLSVFVVLCQNMLSFANVDEETSYTIESVEALIREGRLETSHYIDLFPKVADSYDESKLYAQYLNGVWLSHNREYESALEEFDKVLLHLEEKPDKKLEMLTLEKVIEINDIYGDLIAYQLNAFQLRKLSAGEDDKLYIKALFAIADAHYQTFNEEVAKSYLTIIFEESELIDYELGLSLYHLLYGEIEINNNNYDDSKYHFQKAYAYSMNADQMLGYSYNKMLEIQMATIDIIEGNLDRAFERLSILIDGLENESDYVKRNIYYEYGKISGILGEHGEAIKYYQLALTNDYLVNSRHESRSLSAEINSKLGFEYTELGRYEEAVTYFEKSYEIRKSRESTQNISEQVSTLNTYEIDELQREIDFKQKLRDANEETIAIQREYLRMGFGLISALFLSLLGMLYLFYRKNRVQRKLYFESITDHLTKVFNRGYIINVLEENKKSTSCIMMMDIDDFKMINDTFGHVVGDKVLIRVAEVIEENLREEDSVGRYGGEEFLVILRNTDLEKGLTVAERIRSAIEHLEWDEEIVTTISIGMMQSHNVGTDELLTEADTLMYRAKKTGKNRVVF